MNLSKVLNAHKILTLEFFTYYKIAFYILLTNIIILFMLLKKLTPPTYVSLLHLVFSLLLAIAVAFSIKPIQVLHKYLNKFPFTKNEKFAFVVTFNFPYLLISSLLFAVYVQNCLMSVAEKSNSKFILAVALPIMCVMLFNIVVFKFHYTKDLELSKWNIYLLKLSSFPSSIILTPPLLMITLFYGVIVSSYALSFMLFIYLAANLWYIWKVTLEVKNLRHSNIYTYLNIYLPSGISCAFIVFFVVSGLVNEV